MAEAVTRNFGFLEVRIADGQRAFLTRDGRFQRVLEPGAHRILDLTNAYSVEIFDVVGASLPMDRVRVLESVAPDTVAKHLEIVRAGPDEIVFIRLDDVTRFYATYRNPLAFWKSLTRVELERINIKDSVRADPDFVDRHGMAKSPVVVDEIIESHERGLLSVDGVQTETLAPGRHCFWQVNRKVAVRKFDMRPRPLEITAQEILTKDRVSLRVTVTIFWRITDLERTSQAAEDLGNAIYRLAQFAIREATATRTLDEILNDRDPISKEIRAYVEPHAPEMGVAIGEIGVKDFILPGDMRALLNKVVEAERVARANLIRRQEETAATRSLLNTARLMENNPILLRLKELETLEKLVEKVGRIELLSSSGETAFEPLLKGLFRLNSPPDAAAPAEADKPA